MVYYRDKECEFDLKGKLLWKIVEFIMVIYLLFMRNYECEIEVELLKIVYEYEIRGIFEEVKGKILWLEG